MRARVEKVDVLGWTKSYAFDTVFSMPIFISYFSYTYSSKSCMLTNSLGSAHPNEHLHFGLTFDKSWFDT